VRTTAHARAEECLALCRELGDKLLFHRYYVSGLTAGAVKA